MAIESPLHARHLEAEGSVIPYGPVEAGVLVVETFGRLEIEYASIRKAASLFDLPQRAVVSISGDDRIPFLDSMLTQELKTLTTGDTCRSFWLNRKGRIDADLTLIHFEDRTLIDVDVLSADLLVSTLSEFVFAEDVEIKNVTGEMHRLSMHGPDALVRRGEIADDASGDLIGELAPDRAAVVKLVGADATIWRHDSAGEIGIEIAVRVEDALPIYEALVGHDTVRAAGWHAYNIARIEAGTPIYNLDFGRDSLPHETGVLADRVSFTKGCYLGQEVVARMESLGKPKKQLVALRIEVSDGDAGETDGNIETPQPVSGTPVHPEGDWGGDVVGSITSSTISPMLGSEPIMFATVKSAMSAPGTRLAVIAEGSNEVVIVQESLRFWPIR